MGYSPSWIGQGQQWETPEAFSKWVDSTPRDEVQQQGLKTGFSSTDFARMYNQGAGTTWDPSAASWYLGHGSVTADGTPGGGTGSGISDLFQPGLYPSSSSRSGLSSEYINKIMGGVTPELLKSIRGLGSAPDEYSQNAMELGNASGKEALKFAGQNVLESMANKNMLNSSIAGDAMGKAVGDVAKNIQNTGYQAGIDSAKMKMDIPNILGLLASLGSVSESESSQPNVPYQAAMQFMLGMM